jgi:type IV pilus assembly protein PilM
MAHTITGIDLGTQSVKFAVVEVGFRHARPLPSFAVPVPEGEESLAERQRLALRSGFERLPKGTIAYVAFPGEQATLRILDLPFADARKIEQVVGFEMEGQMVHELADVTLDHRVLSAHGRIEGESGCRALVVAARNDALTAFLADLQASDVEPRAIPVAPLVYGPLLPEEPELLPIEGEPAPGPTCRVVVDLGFRRTQVGFMIGEEPVYGRTLFRGGEELTQALLAAARGAWDYPRAEASKLQLGFVGSARRAPATPAEQQMDGILRPALAPLVRDLRQTLASFATLDRTPVGELLLTGGGSRLTGLGDFLAEELGVPTRLLLEPPSRDEDPDGPAPDFEGDRFALANGIVTLATRGAKQIDLRRGAFQYKASFSIVREKATHLVVLVAALLAAVGIYATMSLQRLSAERDGLRAQLVTATKELFGAARMEATDVIAVLKRGNKDEMVTLPKLTAYDLLDEISRRLPPADKVKLDIEDFDIRPKKVAIKGTVDSAAAVDEMVAKLKEIECFEEINKGPVTEVSGGAKQFSLSIATKCL